MQCLYYGQKRSVLFCVLLYVAYIAAFAGMEVGLAIVVKVTPICDALLVER